MNLLDDTVFSIIVAVTLRYSMRVIRSISPVLDTEVIMQMEDSAAGDSKSEIPPLDFPDEFISGVFLVGGSEISNSANIPEIANSRSVPSPSNASTSTFESKTANTSPDDFKPDSDSEPVMAAKATLAPLPSSQSMFLSTLTSLAVVVLLLLTVRWVLPPLLESSRYSWYRGQLRAEYESAGDQLKNISWDGLSRVSELVSQRVTPSVVHIRIKQNSLNRELNSEAVETGLLDEQHDLMDYVKTGVGSGVIVDSEGHIITNYHVVEEGDVIEVVLSDDSQRTAQVVGWDRARDLAILKIDPPELPSIQWGNSDGAAVGSPVWAVGSPFGLTGSITFGIVSSKHRINLSDSRYQATNRIDPQYSDLMQSDVAVNPGNSGGPLVNGQGQLIGINTAILGETYRGVSFSIPSNIVKVVYDEILSKAKNTSGWLGVLLRPVPPGLQTKSDDGSTNEGSLVAGFAKMGPSPGRDAGLQMGDIIKAVNDQRITSSAQLIDLIKKIPGGTTVRVELVRKGKNVSLNVPLGVRPVQNEPSEVSE